MRIDLHVHTCYSPDAGTTLEQVLAAPAWLAPPRGRGLGALAVTDHNTIAGALALRARSPWPIIVGEEIRTAQGEVIGLFLCERIPPGHSALETVRLIRQQGGLVCVPHPFDRVRRSALTYPALCSILEQVDLLEVLNARVVWPQDNRRAADLAGARQLRAAAGSDAHQGCELGQAYVELPAFQDARGFMQAMLQATPGGGRSSLLVHVGSTWARLNKWLRRV